MFKCPAGVRCVVTAQVLMELRAQLLRGTSAVVRSAAATAMGVLAGSLAADPAIYISTGGGCAGWRAG